jgi:hypothetical protein
MQGMSSTLTIRSVPNDVVREMKSEAALHNQTLAQLLEELWRNHKGDREAEKVLENA